MVKAMTKRYLKDIDMDIDMFLHLKHQTAMIITHVPSPSFLFQSFFFFLGTEQEGKK